MLDSESIMMLRNFTIFDTDRVLTKIQKNNIECGHVDNIFLAALID